MAYVGSCEWNGVEIEVESEIDGDIRLINCSVRNCRQKKKFGLFKDLKMRFKIPLNIKKSVSN